MAKKHFYLVVFYGKIVRQGSEELEAPHSPYHITAKEAAK